MDSEAVERDEVGVLALGLALLAIAAEPGGLLLVGLGVPVPPLPVLPDLPHCPERLSLQLHPPRRWGESLTLALDQGNLKRNPDRQQWTGDQRSGCICRDKAETWKM